MAQTQNEALMKAIRAGLIRALYARAQITEAQFRQLMERKKS